ncbi:hypothetical protein N9M63_00215 [Candidatus Pelagibacter bacterium]|jgi:hypothetical protein|nr:hypothetical protein [Candidatus Pelagibacter bacterium]MDC1223948.1 hypothetical protein [Pelagibacteraceae bacterium]|tara:strand:+ start:4248 stop:4871 length:624 start_codon:yes stop_codon:yes gene_type:complete
MCAPRKVLTIAAIAGLAVATGGLSVGATAGAASATTAASSAAVATGGGASYAATTSTLSSLTTALKVGLKYANVAAPLIGASGMVYSGQVQKGILEQQAAFSNFQASQESETYALRKDQRRRELARALGKQRALYGTSGVALENTPTDILASTARSFSEDDFYDRYGTSGRMVSANISADNLRMSGEQAQLGGLLNAEMTLAQRGTI